MSKFFLSAFSPAPSNGHKMKRQIKNTPTNYSKALQCMRNLLKVDLCVLHTRTTHTYITHTQTHTHTVLTTWNGQCVNLTMESISQCIHILNHIIHPKRITLYNLNIKFCQSYLNEVGKKLSHKSSPTTNKAINVLSRSIVYNSLRPHGL